MRLSYRIICLVGVTASFFSTCNTLEAKNNFQKQIDKFNKAIIYHQEIYENSKRLDIVCGVRKERFERFVSAVGQIKKGSISQKRINNINALLDQVERSVGVESVGVLLLDDLDQIQSLLKLIEKEESYVSDLDKLRKDIKQTVSKANSLQAARAGLLKKRVDVYALGNEIAQKAGWYPGFSSISFGRFGWRKTEGLLCDSLIIDTVKVSDELKKLGRIGAGLDAGSAKISQTFVESGVRVSLVPAEVSNLQLNVESVNWISKKYSVNDKEGLEIGNIFANLQRLGVRYDYKTKKAICDITGAHKTKSHIGYNQGGKLKWINLGDKIEINFLSRAMSKPVIYLSMFDPNRGERIFIAVQFQKKLSKIINDGQSLVFEARGKELGNIWVFNAWGVGREKQRAHELARSSREARKADRLCRLNLSWPVSCSEFFRIDKKSEKVVLRNEVEFEHLTDDWNTKPLIHATITPVMILARSLDVPVELPGNHKDWNIPTKYGTFCTVPANSFEYSIPLPSTGRGRIFADFTQTQWSENIKNQLFYKNSPKVCSVDWAYKGITSALKAVDYIGQQEIYKQADNIIPRILLDDDKFWTAYIWRYEPLSSKRFCYDYPRKRYSAGGGIVDINWGNALCFYGLDTWAAYRDKWHILDKSWDRIWSGFAYFQRTHDWAWATDSISENGEGAAIDCLTACYAGLTGMSRMADTLDKKWEYNQAIYATAKAAITHSTRFGYIEYIQKHDMWHDDSPHTGSVNGFHETASWIHPTKVGPWWGVCSLSGFGMQSECFETAFAYMGRQRMEKWWNTVKDIYPDMYQPKKKYPGVRLIYGGNSQYITLPAIYMDFWLGDTQDNLLKHYKASLANRNGYEFGANVIADIASRNCPVKIDNWGKCKIIKAVFNPQLKEAEVKINNPTKDTQTIIFRLKQKASLSFDGIKPVSSDISKGRWTKFLTTVKVNPGTTKIVFSF